MRIALDTSILAYAEGVGDAARHTTAMSLIARLDPTSTILPAQTLGELFRVLTGKAKRPLPVARDAIRSWSDSFPVADSTWSSFQMAFEISATHQLQIWDALILAVAGESRCRALLSEDFQDGFSWNGVTVVNPFAQEPSPLLDRVIL
jgi:Predicted nucleic-acid-binding protein, contains PIN domain